MLNNKVYNVLKWVAIIVMPALATLVSVILNAWGLPYAEPITTTITAIGTFIGAILVVSNAKYNNSKEDNNV